METVTDKRALEVAAMAESLSPSTIPGGVNCPPDECREKEEQSAPSGETVKKMTSMIQESLDSMNINISFSTYGTNSERISVVVKDKETGEVIREMPAEELQRLHVKMEELMGLIFNDRI